MKNPKQYDDAWELREYVHRNRKDFFTHEELYCERCFSDPSLGIMAGVSDRPYQCCGIFDSGPPGTAVRNSTTSNSKARSRCWLLDAWNCAN